MLSSHRYYRVCVIILLATILLVVACLPFNPTPEAPSVLALKQVKPSIRGIITRVSLTAGIPHSVFVEGQTEGDTAYDRAAVKVTDKTRIYLHQADGYRLTSATQLTTGLRVEAVFTGTILEIDPVRAEADEILILGAD
jgi:hypothetical protein